VKLRAFRLDSLSPSSILMQLDAAGPASSLERSERPPRHRAGAIRRKPNRREDCRDRDEIALSLVLPRFRDANVLSPQRITMKDTHDRLAVVGCGRAVRGARTPHANVRVTFDTGLRSATGVAPTQAEGVESVPGRTGQAAMFATVRGWPIHGG